MKPLKSYHIFSLLTLAFLALASCEKPVETFEPGDYNNINNWAFFPQGKNTGIDVFYVAPTLFRGDYIEHNVDVEDSTTRAEFEIAINRVRGVFDYGDNFYSPYYRQAAPNSIINRGPLATPDQSWDEEAFEIAYEDVYQAFKKYTKSSDRPFVLAGFSQGSEHIIRLIKEEFDDPKLQKRHIATYAIGWRLLQEEVNEYAWLNNAKKEDDLGVIISYNSETEGIDSSFFVPTTTLSINPLTWTTSTEYASNGYHLGAVFIDDHGEIEEEIPLFCGTQIAPERGTLVLPDLYAEDYPPVLGNLPSGIYHVYEYAFFYNNLKENVETRIKKYKEVNK